MAFLQFCLLVRGKKRAIVGLFFCAAPTFSSAAAQLCTSEPLCLLIYFSSVRQSQRVQSRNESVILRGKRRYSAGIWHSSAWASFLLFLSPGSGRGVGPSYYDDDDDDSRFVLSLCVCVKRTRWGGGFFSVSSAQTHRFAIGSFHNSSFSQQPRLVKRANLSSCC